MKMRETIDTSDIRELTRADFARGRKNPYAEKLRKHGFKIVINVTPEDIAEMDKNSIKRIDNMERTDWMDMDDDEIAAMKKYREGIKSQRSFSQEGN